MQPANINKWCMDFTNDEIIKYLADKVKDWADLRYLADNKCVSSYCMDKYEYLIFDGVKENFFVSFSGMQTELCVNNTRIIFLDDNAKKYYIPHSFYKNIVYGGKLNNKSHKEILGLVLKFVLLFNGARDIEVKEDVEIQESTGFYNKSSYIINMHNRFADKGSYVFDNILVNISWL